MWEMVAGLPSQLRWAEQLEVPSTPTARSVLVTGMGGSGIAGDYVAPVAGAAGVFVHTHKSYGLPGWVATLRPMIVAVSYSGNTEETLSGFEAALETGIDGVAITSGGALGERAEAVGWPVVLVPDGLQPRAALGYLAGALLQVMSAGSGLDVRPMLGESADVVDELLGPDGDGPGVRLAADLADGLADRIVLVYGSDGPTGVVAERWKTQINENGKTPAFRSLLPELDHNEVAGWAALPNLTRRTLGAVFLRDESEHPRVSHRFELTRLAMTDAVPVVGEVRSMGESLLARMMSLTFVGDAFSVRLAEQTGIDPIPVEVIEDLKQELESLQ
jgi:glucose/mannose-6-phosphate isomerase